MMTLMCEGGFEKGFLLSLFSLGNVVFVGRDVTYYVSTMAHARAGSPLGVGGARVAMPPRKKNPKTSLSLQKMKRKHLTHIMRFTLLLLFFGWGMGSAEACSAGIDSRDASRVENSVFPHEVSSILGTTPTKPTALAADLADPAVGPALLDFLSGNAAGITAANRLDRLKAWEVCFIDDVVRTNPDKLTKVSRYLDNNPNAEAALKAEFNITPANKRGLFVDRTSYIDDLNQQYGPFNTSANFEPQGLTSINQNVYDDMLNEYPTSLPNREEILDGVIKTGSTTPVKVVYQHGDELYKVVPKGESVGPKSPFWMTLDELNSLKTSGGLEQKLGLPLDSHGVKYDVYKISANLNSNVYQSTVANTIESGYSTAGGATQSLVLKRSNWSSPSKVDEIIPEL